MLLRGIFPHGAPQLSRLWMPFLRQRYSAKDLLNIFHCLQEKPNGESNSTSKMPQIFQKEVAFHDGSSEAYNVCHQLQELSILTGSLQSAPAYPDQQSFFASPM